MLGVVAERFLRTEWKSVQDLATELHAIFRQPLDISPGSITINQPAGVNTPPVTINQPIDSTAPGVQVTRGTEQTGVGSSGGGTDLGGINFPGQQPGTVVEAVPAPSNNPIVLHGRVGSKVQDSVYSVSCWATNPATKPPIGVLNVEFPDVDKDETIPPGARVPVLIFPGFQGGQQGIEKAIGYIAVWYAEETP